MKVIKLSAILLLFAGLFSTCKKEEKPQSRFIHIMGKIKDKRGNLISGVKVIAGEYECRDGLPNLSSKLTMTTFTNENGIFSLYYFDQFPNKPTYRDKEGVLVNDYYNCLHHDYIWFEKDGYYYLRDANRISIEANNGNVFVDTAIILRKYSLLKLILNPVSVANGISVLGYGISLIPDNFRSYTSNLYANPADGCRVDSPRNAEFFIYTIPSSNYNIEYKIYPGGKCNYIENKKTILTNPELSTDTLVYQIDY